MIVKEFDPGLAPHELFRAFHDRAGSFFLDSAQSAGGIGEYSFLGFDPFLSIRAWGSRISLRVGGSETSLSGDPLTELRKVLNKYRAPAHASLPFTGGAVGYFSYELCAQFEGIPRRSVDDLKLPDMEFGFYDGIIACDHVSGRCYLVANPVCDADPQAIIERLEAAVAGAKEGRRRDGQSEAGKVQEAYPQSNFTKQEYCQAIERIRDYIRSGDVYQVNLTQRFEMPLSDDPYAVYSRLRERNPAPFACYLNLESHQVVGSSPERFLRIKEGRVETRPIKGTRPRGNTREEDLHLRDELAASAKDRAELLMIVDLERNDLGRVCEYGSIKVEENYRLESYATVHHLVAIISGKLREGHDVIDCIRAAFPGGSITGAPKIRAMQIIDELESRRRYGYTGAFGYLGFDGNCDLNIAIRTIFCLKGRAYFHVGGGITWDSDPESEYQETLDKGRAMHEALTGLKRPQGTMNLPREQQSVILNGCLCAADTARVSPLGDGFMYGAGLFETIKVKQGRLVFLAEHLQRLYRSAAELRLAYPTAAAELARRCTRLVAANGLGEGSLKIVLFRDLNEVGELLVTSARSYALEQYRRGFSLKTMPDARHPAALPGLKTLNYLKNSEARRAASQTGFDDALFVGVDGTVWESAASNLFVVKSGVVITPPADGCILPGIVRQRLLGHGPALSVLEKEVSLSDLLAADEVFLTNSLLGVMPVSRIDQRSYDLAHTPVTRSFVDVYAGLEAFEISKAPKAPLP